MRSLLTGFALALAVALLLAFWAGLPGPLTTLAALAVYIPFHARAESTCSQP